MISRRLRLETPKPS